jgi:hypothetical protein
MTNKMSFCIINDLLFTTLDQLLFKIMSVNPQGLIRAELLERLNKRLDPKDAYPRTTVYDHIKTWILQGFIEEQKIPHGGRGRPYVLFSLSNKGMTFFQRAHEEGYW